MQGPKSLLGSADRSSASAFLVPRDEFRRRCSRRYRAGRDLHHHRRQTNAAHDPCYRRRTTLVLDLCSARTTSEPHQRCVPGSPARTIRCATRAEQVPRRRDAAHRTCHRDLRLDVRSNHAAYCVPAQDVPSDAEPHGRCPSFHVRGQDHCASALTLAAARPRLHVHALRAGCPAVEHYRCRAFQADVPLPLAIQDAALDQKHASCYRQFGA